MICTRPMNGPCSMMYMTPRHIIVAARASAECTALRNSTMPMPPASAIGPRIQNETASPSGTSPCISGPAARTAVLIGVPAQAWSALCGAVWWGGSSVVPSDLDGVSGDRAPGDVGRTLRRALLQRGLRFDRVIGLLVITQAHRVRRGLHAGQQRRHQLLLGVDQLLAVVEG